MPTKQRRGPGMASTSTDSNDSTHSRKGKVSFEGGGDGPGKTVHNRKKSQAKKIEKEKREISAKAERFASSANIRHGRIIQDA